MSSARPVAVVSGAARGIGAATVLALVRSGWSVVAFDAAADDPAVPYALGDAAGLDELVDRANSLSSGSTEGVIADVRDLDAVRAVVERAERSFGGVDALVGAAGVMAGGVPQWEVPIEQEAAVIDVNLRGVLNLARAGVPALLRRPPPRAGRFIAIASAGATRGLPMLAAYCAAKAGVSGFVRALAVELAPSGVTVNAVSPGSTETAMLTQSARLYGLPAATNFADQQPMRRLLDPAEVAAVISFLAGPGGSGVTGATVPVDAGLAL